MKKSQLRTSWLLPLLLLVGWSRAALAQVTTDPVFFTVDTPITLTLDASQGDAGLKGYTGTVYIYTGVITSKSANSGDWKYLKNGSFNAPTAAEAMTSLGNNKYSISFTPSSFYPGLAAAVASGETVQKLAMVFRGAGGSPQGKGPGSTDIFVTVSQSTTTLQVALTSPASGNGANPAVVQAGTSVSVAGTSTISSTLTLTLNGTQVGQQTGTSFSQSVPVVQPGVNTFVLTATSGGATVTSSAVVIVPPAPIVADLPAGAKPDGITYLANGTSAIISFTAPNKSFVYLLGDFNNWQPTNALQLRQTASVNSDPTTGRWWVQVDGLTAGKEYAYQLLVDGNLRVADPYCEKILDPYNDKYISLATYPNPTPYPTGLTTGNVSVLQTNQTAYNWTTTSFKRPDRTNLVIYELLMRDFTDAQNYATVTDSIAYLKRLGVNCIELMPVNEFDGNDSWGYNPAFYFAPDKAYGTKNDFKKFIDVCHANGIAVVMDMVLNHSCGGSPLVQLYFNSSTGNPASNNPWYNVTATHPYNVCYDFNHESQYTKYFTKNVMKFWLQEYHIDGYRFDLSKGFTQHVTTDVGAWGAYDASRVAIWKDYYDTMKATDATMYPILEHFAVNDEDKELANYGLMPWGNMAANYQQADMGYASNFDLDYGYYGNTSFGGRGYNFPNLVTYMESHDEERTMYKTLNFGNASGSYSTKDPVTALKREELAAAIFFSQPGPRMIYEFEETGFDKSIFTCGSGTVPTPYGNDQCKTDRKSPVWSYYQDANRRHLYEVYRAMINLRQQPAFAAPTNYAQYLYDKVKYIQVRNADLSVITVGNFDVAAQTSTVFFPNTGTWYNYLDGSTLNVTTTGMSMTLQPGQYGVYTSRKLNSNSALSTRAQDAAVLQLTAAPNPAAGSTAVRYSLPSAASAALTLQNVLGQTVRELPAVRQGAGQQSQELSLQGLAPGLYLLRLQAGDRTQTTRLQVQ